MVAVHLDCFNCKKFLNKVNADLRYGSLIRDDLRSRKKSDMNNKLGIKTCGVNPASVVQHELNHFVISSTTVSSVCMLFISENHYLYN